jgi:pimeloyl-ACP methyl ester carboxylesterase
MVARQDRRRRRLSPRGARFAAAALVLATGSAALAAAKQTHFIIQDQLIPGPEPGVQLHVRNKYWPSSTIHFDDAVLFVHGATFPASSTFDVALADGDSWMSLVAYRGLNVYSLDIRGYGGSTRPAAMSQPAEANPPFARTTDAVRDIGVAVDFILKRNHAHTLTLIGWSWGTTTTTATYAALNPDKVRKLILVSPVWLPMQPPQYKGAYRVSTHDSARAFAIAGIPKERVDEISPPANFETWWTATLATDPEGAKQSPPVVRSPNGVMQDFAELWAQGKPTYDPAAIRTPTLLIVGEWDVVSPPQMAETLYTKLVNARERRLVLMSEGTHFMLIEKHRLRLVHEVLNFLQEPVE